MILSTKSINDDHDLVVVLTESWLFSHQLLDSFYQLSAISRKSADFQGKKFQGGKIQTKKSSAIWLAEERRKDSGFGPSDGWLFGPVSATWCGYIGLQHIQKSAF